MRTFNRSAGFLSTGLIAAGLLASWSAPSQLQAAPWTFRQVAITGDPAGPGGPPIDGLVNAPAFNGDRVVFHSAASVPRVILQDVSGLVTEVVDTNTPMPFAGGNFVSFGSYWAMDDDCRSPACRELFFRGNRGSVNGLYHHDGTTVTRVVDNTFAMPDLLEPLPNFTSFGNTNGIDGADVVYFGAGVLSRQGIYRQTLGNLPVRLADKQTAIPGGTGLFTSFSPWAQIDEGLAVFHGAGAADEGIYGHDGSLLFSIATTATVAPDGTGELFTDFSGNPVVDEETVGFIAQTSQRSGVYLYGPGGLEVLADTSMAAPGGSGANFNTFITASLDDGKAAFVAIDDDGHIGLYTNLGGALELVASDGLELAPGETILALSISPMALNGDSLAFQVDFESGNQAIFVATIVPEPAALGILSALAAMLMGGRSVRRNSRRVNIAAPVGYSGDWDGRLS